ncbi:cytochrome c556 [Rhizobium sp. BK650]|uniref:cytochrome c n=1 Tax=Rhizobium sp. BK650 TaxID=2586990 RepID=UPI00160E0496|nr:cytochrome c [Rhizobium sp. BK650]MBB3660881.1 cytochrome c556 [Rhizobium sp. BK650]
MSEQMRWTIKRLMLAASSTFLLVPTITGAVDDIATSRQQDMKEIAAAAKTIAEMFKSPGTYSSSGFKQAAMAISARADERLTSHFSTLTMADGSTATEAIRTEQDRFAALAKDLHSLLAR